MHTITTTGNKTTTPWSYTKTTRWCKTPQFQLWTCLANSMSTRIAGREEKTVGSQTCLQTEEKKAEKTMVSTKLKHI